MTLRALLGHPAQNSQVQAALSGTPRSPAEAEALGQDVARQLQTQAGAEWLAALVA
jgi:hypothetical protein